MGTGSSKADSFHQRRVRQGIAVAQAEKKLDARQHGSGGEGGGVEHKAIAPGTLPPIKTSRRDRARKAGAPKPKLCCGCSKRRRSKRKKTAVVLRPSSAGGLTVEVGGKRFTQAGEVRRREAAAAQAAAVAQQAAARADDSLEAPSALLPAADANGREEQSARAAWDKDKENEGREALLPAPKAPRRLGPLIPPGGQKLPAAGGLELPKSGWTHPP